MMNELSISYNLSNSLNFNLITITNMNVIQTINMTKRFGSTIAVNDVSINVREGEIYGFLGLNGAGKTTTIRLLLGMIKSDGGSCFLFGRKAKQASDLWNNVGYLVETPYNYPDLSVMENLEVFYRLRGLYDKVLLDEIMEKLQLTRYADKKAKFLSMGNKQRLGLAKALMHKPRLLILDEPVNGLDPSGIVEVREMLKDLTKNHNTTIFLSSHILSEISKLATRIGIIDEGKLIKELNSADLEQQVIKKLCIKTTDNYRALQLLNNEGLHFTADGNDSIETTAAKAIEHPEQIATLLVESNLPPGMLYIYEEDLEAYFLRIIGKQKKDYEAAD
ncbi:MAG TPA: ABC transporter ATP-binding protein [Ignavibacteriaceae bacterium]|nr:ABC transporter ATP-binding protein [Ignavibacteriaceae bacterium]